MKKVALPVVFMSILMILTSNGMAGQNTFTLVVLVDGAKANKGQAVASLFSSEENYLKAPLVKLFSPIDSAGEARFEFPNLPAGTYAVSVVYDENSDGKLNTGLFGIPTELVGVSNNAKGVFGPPSFDKTSFSVPESESISISLNPASE